MTTTPLEILARSESPAWDERKTSVAELGAYLSDLQVFDRLVAMLDDEDTGVGQQAAVVLTTRGGIEGLAAVAKAYATLDDDIGYFIAGALGNLWQNADYPLPANLRAVREQATDPDVIRGVDELGEYLHAA